MSQNTLTRTRICLYEDAGVSSLEPLTLTRPVFDLFCGAVPLSVKQSCAFGCLEAGALVRSSLAAFCRQEHPELVINDPHWLDAGPVILVNGRWLPPLKPLSVPDSPCIGLVDDEPAFVVLPEGVASDLDPDAPDALLETFFSTLPTVPAGGRLIGHLWDLVDDTSREMTRDFAHLAAVVRDRRETPTLGPREQLLMAPDATVEPMALIDTTRGPVILAGGAVVSAFTRLEGPCYVGPHTQILGARVRSGCTFGPHCRIGGEVEASILQGYSNKYHDGFLGHSYVGAWVNLGAGTSNSDLRNDYGPVHVPVAGRMVPTGRTKVGCFLGDHTRTGLGTLLNTGTSAGVFCNLLPSGGFLPKELPSFTRWWNGTLEENRDLEGLLRTAAIVMGRRGMALTENQEGLYRFLMTQTASDRRRVLGRTRTRRTA